MSIDIRPLLEGRVVNRGTTIRVNHTDCPAGQDTRRRLYLTRPAATPNVVLGYCHNCQESGYYSTHNTDDKQYRGHFAAAKQVDVFPGADFKIPAHMQEANSLWPTDAQAWRMKKGLSIGDCGDADIQYDPSTHRIFLPMYDHLQSGVIHKRSELLGFQLCRLNDRGSKYMNVYRDSSVSPSTRITIPKHKDSTRIIGFVVEDLASGLRISNALKNRTGANFGAEILVNYGTKVTPTVLSLPKGVSITDGIVWLDNDSTHVAEQAMKIAKVWHMLTGVEMHIEDLATDPKALDYDAILAVINRHIKWK